MEKQDIDKDFFVWKGGYDHFRENTILTKDKVNIIFNGGGLGDNIARLPPLKHILEKAVHLNPIIWVPDYLFPMCSIIFPKANINPFSLNETKFDKHIPGIPAERQGITTLRTHLVDYSFMCLVDKQVEIEEKNYLQFDSRPYVDSSKYPMLEKDKYVVLTPGFRSDLREMPVKTINELADYIISKGYKVVFLGSTNSQVGTLNKKLDTTFKDEIDYSKGIKLLNNTTLIEAHYVLSQAKVVVGVDNGLLHVAGMSEVPIVAGYTSVEPKYRVPYRHNELGWNCYVIEPDVACRGCQSKWTMVNTYDFKDCFYSDKLCTTQMTSDKFIKQLEKVL